MVFGVALATIVALSPTPAKTPTIKVGPITQVQAALVGIQVESAITSGAKEIVLDIDSPGGSVSAGFAIIDELKAARAKGVEVRCEVHGMAASMAAILVESAACSTRVMSKGSQLLFHEPSIGESDGGTEWDFRRLANHLADLNRRIAVTIGWKLGMTADQYVAWVKERDRWLDWHDAIKMGAIDVIE